MNCNQVGKLIPDFIDEKLASIQNQQFEQHINECSNCKILFQKTENTLKQLKIKSEIPEQAFYYTRLKQRMENRNIEKTRFLNAFFVKKILQPIIYMASIIIAVYIGILIGSNSNQTQFSEVKNLDQNYIETFAEYQYINDFEIEDIENIFISEKETMNE